MDIPKNATPNVEKLPKSIAAQVCGKNVSVYGIPVDAGEIVQVDAITFRNMKADGKLSEPETGDQKRSRPKV